MTRQGRHWVGSRIEPLPDDRGQASKTIAILRDSLVQPCVADCALALEPDPVFLSYLLKWAFTAALHVI